MHQIEVTSFHFQPVAPFFAAHIFFLVTQSFNCHCWHVSAPDLNINFRWSKQTKSKNQSWKAWDKSMDAYKIQRKTKSSSRWTEAECITVIKFYIYIKKYNYKTITKNRYKLPLSTAWAVQFSSISAHPGYFCCWYIAAASIAPPGWIPIRLSRPLPPPSPPCIHNTSCPHPCMHSSLFSFFF